MENAFCLTLLQCSFNVALAGSVTGHESLRLRRLPDVADEKKLSRRTPDDDSVNDDEPDLSLADASTRVKFEIFGEEMIEKRVKASGNSGRVYLPPDWVGHKVKIIRID